MDWTKFEPLAGYAIYAIVYCIGFCLMFSPPIWWIEYAPRANIPNAVVWTAGIAYFGHISIRPQVIPTPHSGLETMADAIIWVIVFCLGISAGWGMCSDNWQKDMVQRGYAEHSQMTGKWQWKTVP